MDILEYGAELENKDFTSTEEAEDQ